jgi:hypothetical protein
MAKSYSIPVTVLKAEKAGEYVALLQKRKIASRRKSEAESFYLDVQDKIARCFRHEVGDLWKRALIIQELSSQLVTLAGDYRDADREYRMLDVEIEVLKAGK